MVKKRSFAAEMEDLMNSRAPKEALADEEATPALLDDDAWGEQLEALDAGAGKKGKRLRLRGALGSAFTEGSYKGRVVDKSAAFDPFAGGDGMQEQHDDDDDGGSLEGEEGEEFEEMDEEEEAAGEMAVDDDDDEPDLSADVGLEEEDEELEELEEGSDDGEEVLADARKLFSTIDLEADTFRPKKQAPKNAAKLAGNVALNYEEKPPGADEEDAADAKSDDSLVLGKTGKVNEAAISAKMDDIFGALDFDGSEDDEKGETYEQFVEKVESRKKTRRRRAMKRKREDFDSEGSEADASEQEADADIAEQIAAIREAQATTSRDIVKTLANEADRADAARNQYKLWGKLVGARIHLHPLISAASRFPTYSFSDFRDEEGIPSALADVKQQLADVMTDLHGLREAMLENNPSLLSNPHHPIPPVYKNATEKGQAYSSKDLNGYWRLCSASASMVAAQADQVLDQWYSRAQLQGANAAEGASIKKADTSAAAQVRETLQREHDRLVHRTQKNRTGKLPLGHPMAGEAQENASIAQLPENLTNPQIFDDSDFYSFLLQDYIHNCAEGTMTTTEDLEKIRRTAKDPSRQLVDKRRSKQRKLSHEPIPKLVGFVAPVPQDVPSIIDSLYASLFSAP